MRTLFAAVEKIIKAYREGTSWGFSAMRMGLSASRAPGTPTSWMDAKVGDWVMTPSRGRTVELNALWFNCAVDGGAAGVTIGKIALAQEWEDAGQESSGIV